MKYIAIKDDFSTHKQWGFNFEKGKIYEIEDLNYVGRYMLHGDRCDTQVSINYIENYFITLSKYRKLKLEKINGQKERQ